MDYDKINQTILKALEELKKRPGMYFPGEKTYNTFRTYLAGYLMGLHCCSNKKVSSEINGWFEKKENKFNWF